MTLFKEVQKEVSKGPGYKPAPSFLIIGALVGFFVFTQAASAIDFRTFDPYTPPSAGSDSQAGARKDSQFDSKRMVERFQRNKANQEIREQGRKEENIRTQQTQEVEQNVAHTKEVSRAMADEGKQEAAQITSRMGGLDTYSVDKTGGVWRSHLGLLAEAWNVFSQDLYGNVSRSRMSQVTYDSLDNIAGMARETVDQAGRKALTVISDIAYQAGEAFRNYLGNNKESARKEVTTTDHPTGNQVTQTETYDVQYADGKDGKTISQKTKITDLTGPSNPILQETFNMKYDGDSVVHSETRTTDLVTGTVTEGATDNQFSGSHMTTGVTETTTKDSLSHTITHQTSTQHVSYGGETIQTIESNSVTTTQAMDDAGNAADDYLQTTETTQTMGLYGGIPDPAEIVSVSHTLDNIAHQTVESTQTQNFVRDEHRNLLGVSATEVSTNTNADGSVVQVTEGTLDFMVRADQSYLTGRRDTTTTVDAMNGQNSTTNSDFRIQLGSLGEVLSGTRTSQTHVANRNGSIVTDVTAMESFDRAALVNALGLIQRESSSHTVNALTQENPVTTDETRVYTQSHDEFNRVLGAGETVESFNSDTLGEETRVNGTVAYAIGTRSNQPYTVSSVNHITSKDPRNFLYTESTQTTTFESDPNTGKAIQGLGVTDGASWRMQDDGTVLYDPLTIQTHSEETLVGLDQSNAFGLVSRATLSDTTDHISGLVTHEENQLTQQVNGLGKIENAYLISQSTRDIAGAPGLQQTFSLARTDFTIIGNETFSTSTKTVEVTVDRRDNSYESVTWEDVNHYGPYGELLGVTMGSKTSYKATGTLLPGVQPDLEALFQQSFGMGVPR